MALSVSWTNTWMTNATVADQIDDQVNSLSSGVTERMTRGGHNWPLSASDTCGVHMLSSSALHANEFNVYKSSKGVTKLLSITSTAINLNLPVLAAATSTAHQFSSQLKVKDYSTSSTAYAVIHRNNYRYLVLSCSGHGNGAVANVADMTMEFPQGLKGTIIEFHLGSNVTTGTLVVNLRKVTWGNTGLISTSGSDCATLTLTGASDYRTRTTTISNPTLSGGEILFPYVSTTANRAVNISVVIRLDWE